jgi:PAS domain S-box-containing protein
MTCGHDALPRDLDSSGPLLRESEERFRLVFDQSPIGKALIGLDGRYERVNAALCHISGYSEAELLSLNVVDTTHPDYLVREAAAKASLLSGDRASYRLEAPLRRADNCEVWVDTLISSVSTESGVIKYFMAHIQDITEVKEQAHALAEERRRLLESQTIGRNGWWDIDLRTNVITRSDTLHELYGVLRDESTGDYPEILDAIHPEDRAKVDAVLEACKSTGEPVRVGYRVTRANDGALRWMDARGQAQREGGQVVRIVGSVADVTEMTEQVMAEAEARAAQAFQQAIISASPDLIFVYDIPSLATVWTNRSITEMLGSTGAVSGAEETDLIGLMPEDDQAQFELAVSAARHGRDDQVTQFNHRLQHADGTPRWFSQRTTPLSRDARGRVTQLVGALRDITDAVALEKQLEHYSLHDRLTGLPNRALLVDRLEAALARSRREGREVAVLFCDLDGFKRVNDNAGHAAGDAVLAEVASRLTSVMRDEDTVARVGGDEFVVIVEPWNRTESDYPNQGAQLAPSTDSDRSLALLVAERVHEGLREPVTVNGVEHVMSVSIGITYSKLSAIDQAGVATAEELLADADAAMYQAKRLGKARFEVFEHGMRADLAERGRVEHVLRAALQSHSNTPPRTLKPTAERRLPAFAAAYQPIFGSRTGALAGFEALARLTDSAGHGIAPDVFIVVAEETGLIQRLGTVMLELACGQLALWREAHPAMSHATMAVNVSAMQAQHSTLGDDVRNTLTRHHLAPSDLVLELTETALLQAAHSTITSLRVLREQGVGIAIDDFGTGYSSLRYLTTLPVSAVKVDRSFTAGLTTDQTCRKIVYAVAGLAADMDLTCVVEGVESQDQLAALPPDVLVQGWLTGRAQDPAALDLPKLLADTTAQRTVKPEVEPDRAPSTRPPPPRRAPRPDGTTMQGRADVVAAAEVIAADAAREVVADAARTAAAAVKTAATAAAAATAKASDVATRARSTADSTAFGHFDPLADASADEVAAKAAIAVMLAADLVREAAAVAAALVEAELATSISDAVAALGRSQDVAAEGSR